MESNFESAIFIFTLLIIFQFKHFFADYLLQIPYMLGKFKAKNWEVPLLAHTSVHGFFTLGICLFYDMTLYISVTLALFDLVVHFVVDRVKASPYMFGKYKPTEKMFWLALGGDQLMHHITHYIVIFTLVYHTYI